MNAILQEEVAAINLAKYRKVHEELEDAESRADSAENQLAKVRVQNRSMSASRSTTVVWFIMLLIFETIFWNIERGTGCPGHFN